jgi:hypothetical protein
MTKHENMTKCENKNALKHGAFAEALILINEDRSAFNALVAELCEEWDPQGRTEFEIVNSIATNMWRRRRFTRHLKKTYRDGVEADFGYWNCVKRFRDFLRDIRLGKVDTVTEDNLAERFDPDVAAMIKQDHPRKNYDSDAAWLKVVGVEVSKVISELMKKGPRQTFDEELSDENFAERELSFEERIDAKIAKDLKMLGQIKTMKAIGLGRSGPTGTRQPPKQIDPL